jgi:hypothetical protein
MIPAFWAVLVVLAVILLDVTVWVLSYRLQAPPKYEKGSNLYEIARNTRIITSNVIVIGVNVGLTVIALGLTIAVSVVK